MSGRSRSRAVKSRYFYSTAGTPDYANRLGGTGESLCHGVQRKGFRPKADVHLLRCCRHVATIGIRGSALLWGMGLHRQQDACRDPCDFTRRPLRRVSDPLSAVDFELQFEGRALEFTSRSSLLAQESDHQKDELPMLQAWRRRQGDRPAATRRWQRVQALLLADRNHWSTLILRLLEPRGLQEPRRSASLSRSIAVYLGLRLFDGKVEVPTEGPGIRPWTGPQPEQHGHHEHRRRRKR